MVTPSTVPIAAAAAVAGLPPSEKGCASTTGDKQLVDATRFARSREIWSALVNKVFSDMEIDISIFKDQAQGLVEYLNEHETLLSARQAGFVETSLVDEAIDATFVEPQCAKSTRPQVDYFDLYLFIQPPPLPP